MKRIYAGLAFGLLLAGCNHSSNPSATDSGATASNTQADGNHPMADYALVGSDANDWTWLMKLYMARETTPPTNEQKLQTLVPNYLFGSDAFQKRDLATSELPKINSELKRFAEQAYYKSQPGVFFSMVLTPYDLTTHSFGISQCRDNTRFQSPQAFNIRLVPLDDGVCMLSVPDESQARQIESLRAGTGVLVETTTYFHVDNVDSRNAVVNATITHLHVELFNSLTHQPLGSFDTK